MSQLPQFDADTARRIETLYLIHDVYTSPRAGSRGTRGSLQVDRILDVDVGGAPPLELSEVIGSVPGSVVGVDSSRDAWASGASPLRWSRQRRRPPRRRKTQQYGLENGASTARSAYRFSSTSQTWMQLWLELRRALRTGRACSRLGRGLGDGVDSLATQPHDLCASVPACLGRASGRPSVPRTLGVHLRSAGFRDVGVEAHAFAASGRDPENLGAALVPYHREVRRGRARHRATLEDRRHGPRSSAS